MDVFLIKSTLSCIHKQRLGTVIAVPNGLYVKNNLSHGNLRHPLLVNMHI